MPRPRHGTIVAYLALFITLGGVSWAAIRLPAASVGTRELKAGAVTKSKLADGVAVRGRRGRRGVAGATGPRGPAGVAGAAGSAGADGREGPKGPPGIAYGPPPDVHAAAQSVAAGTVTTIASVTFSNDDGVAHRLSLSGGFNAACDPCTAERQPSFGLQLAGSQTPLVKRYMAPFANASVTPASASLSDIVVAPAVCGPCTFNLVLSVPGNGSGDKIAATDAQLGYVDLGPVQ
jgi:hypothetical protein